MERFARTIILASEIREESYDQEMSDNIKGKERLYFDFEKCYKKSLKDACDLAALENGYDLSATEPLYLLLKCCWNDILNWADKVVNNKKLS